MNVAKGEGGIAMKMGDCIFAPEAMWGSVQINGSLHVSFALRNIDSFKAHTKCLVKTCQV